MDELPSLYRSSIHQSKNKKTFLALVKQCGACVSGRAGCGVPVAYHFFSLSLVSSGGRPSGRAETLVACPPVTAAVCALRGQHRGASTPAGAVLELHPFPRN